MPLCLQCGNKASATAQKCSQCGGTRFSKVDRKISGVTGLTGAHLDMSSFEERLQLPQENSSEENAIELAAKTSIKRQVRAQRNGIFGGFFKKKKNRNS